jgi:hypothetical protein
VLRSRRVRIPFPAPEATSPFTLWFNSSPDLVKSDARRTHLESVRQLMTTAETSSGGQLCIKFRTDQPPAGAGWDVFP